jgi:hypothetical protein
MNSISIGKSLGWAAETFFKHWQMSLKILLCPFIGLLVFIALALPLVAISSTSSALLDTPVVHFGMSIYGLFLIFAPMAAFFVFIVGIINIACMIYQHGVSSMRQLFSLPWQVLARVFVVGILYHTLVFLGLICLIIPGLYLATRYYFALFVAIKERAGIVDSFTRAAQLSQGNMWQTFGIYLLTHILAGTGVLFFMGTLMSVHAYGTRLGQRPYGQ